MAIKVICSCKLVLTLHNFFSPGINNFLIFFYYIFYPFTLIFGGWKWLLSKIFRFKDDDVVTEDEIITMVEEAEEDGEDLKKEVKALRAEVEALKSMLQAKEREPKKADETEADKLAELEKKFN